MQKLSQMEGSPLTFRSPCQSSLCGCGLPLGEDIISPAFQDEVALEKEVSGEGNSCVISSWHTLQMGDGCGGLIKRY